jgi:hypothetical protein
MRGGRRSRSRKTAAKEEPIVRVAPTRRSRAKVRRPSRPVTPKIPESVQKRIEEMIASGRMKAPGPKKPAPKKTVAKKKPVPPKVTRPKPVARRKPAVQPVRKPKPPELTPEVQKRIQEALADLNIGGSRQPKRRAAPKPSPKRKTTPRKTVAKKAAPKKTVAKKKPVEPKLPEGVRSGGKTYTNPVSGDKMYQPPMPKVGKGRVQAMVMPTPINLTTGKPERLMISETGVKSGGASGGGINPGMGVYRPDGTEYRLADPDFDITEIRSPQRAKGKYLTEKPTTAETSSSQTSAPQAPTPPATQAPDTQQFSSDPKIAKLQKYFLDRGLGIPPRAESSFEEKEDYKEYLIDMKKDVRSNFGDPTNPALGYKPEEAAYLAENQPKYQEFNERLKESQRMAREPNKYADRFFRPTSTVGTPDSLIPSNIVGQSFDPSFAASFTPPPQPPGSVFGGYGQQAPMAALAPYAGMAQSQPMPTDFFPSYVPKPAPIIETVQRPEPNRPTPRPDARPVMGGGSGRMMGGAGIDRGFGRDQINYGEFIP